MPLVTLIVFVIFQDVLIANFIATSTKKAIGTFLRRYPYTPPMDKKQIGVLAIVGASIMWAIEPIFAKLAYSNASVVQTSAFRAIFVTIVALIYALTTNGRNIKITKKEFSVIFYIAVVGTLIADLLFYIALTKIPVLNAVLIGHLQPIFIIFIGYFILRNEKHSKYDYIGIFVMIVGALLVTTQTLENLLVLRIGTIGDLLVIGATVSWATTGVIARKYLKTMNCGIITFYRFLIAAIFFSIYLIFKSEFQFGSVNQIIIGVIVGVGYILYYEGLKRVKAAQAGALELSTPFFAAILGFLVLGEIVTPMQIIGILILCVGVYLLSKKE
ncbi:MAG: DMT family transporter [Candidatus Methanofastidiosa archaeon]|jgi:drug/metabolite transporter (DMT)-like permease|nr:DMT family transporter [Candidatus Methanofastidiosa archaeon]HOM95859.1 DMT family transporter [Methanofastidiosum sp.]HPC80973.1 DMT family transporter [Methanofastidiosum sp.]HRS25526.1 DMT family transporter [Methanofastidiosum sp.]